MPYSNKQQAGFENKIAQILARELNAKLTYSWLPQPYGRARDSYLELGRCDAVMGVPDGADPFLTTLAYYRASYVFLYKKDSPGHVSSFDDPRLKQLTIGVQTSGSSISPASYALARRGLIERQRNYPADFKAPNPMAALVHAVARNEVDVGIVWGPIAGYFASQERMLEWVSVSPQIDSPFMPMSAPMTIGLRQGDEDLRDLLDYALVENWEAVQGILQAYNVPLDTPQPERPSLIPSAP